MISLFRAWRKTKDKKGNCGQRAFRAGLRWCGIEDEVPHIQRTEQVQKLAEEYGLTFLYDKDSFKPDNRVILAAYKDNFIATDGEYHCVFISDYAPLEGKEIHCVVLGWEKLRKKMGLNIP